MFENFVRYKTAAFSAAPLCGICFRRRDFPAGNSSLKRIPCGGFPATAGRLLRDS